MDTRNNKFKLDFMPIGQDIKQAREAKDVTREQLSEVIDYAPRHIQAIENEGQTPSVDLLFQLAEMFDVSLDRHIFKDRDNVKSSIRRRVDTLLDGLIDKDLVIVEAVIRGIHQANEMPKESHNSNKRRADDLVSFLTSSSALRLCVWLFDDGDLLLSYFNKRFLLAFRAI